MPSADTASRLDNIHRSIDRFLQEKIETGLSETIFYMFQHMPSNLTDSLTRWIVATVNDLGQIGPLRGAGSGQSGAMRALQLDLNLYEKSDSSSLTQTSRYALSTLATEVKELFGSRSGGIKVYDYTDVAVPHVGLLRPSRFPTVIIRHDAENIGIRQADVRVELTYVDVVND